MVHHSNWNWCLLARSNSFIKVIFIRKFSCKVAYGCILTLCEWEDVCDLVTPFLSYNDMKQNSDSPVWAFYFVLNYYSFTWSTLVYFGMNNGRMAPNWAGGLCKLCLLLLLCRMSLSFQLLHSVGIRFTQHVRQLVIISGDTVYENKSMIYRNLKSS